MKTKWLPLVGMAVLCPAVCFGQDVDRTKFADFTLITNPDYSLVMKARSANLLSTSGRPDHVHNGLTPYFAPTFNQDNGSCGSAAMIAYQMAHELNAYRGLSGKLEQNMLPTHFTWNLTYGNSSKETMAMANGVPSVAVYGGRTYSRIYGSFDWDSPDTGWMQGYDKWYSAMFNRMASLTSIPSNLSTEEGREIMKNWLWNHCGDESFMAGGVAHIGVASNGKWEAIPKTDANDAAGVTGMYYVKSWGTSVDHALTIVGYDDRVEFDLNGNGVYGEKDADETGAWIIANSWGNGWCNGGFIYCPYAYAGSNFNSDGTFNTGSWWAPAIVHIRKDYTPQRTIRLKMDYSRRSELYLSAGVSADLNATEPDVACGFEHFKYAGDGNEGKTVPAPEVPMLGRWADGQLHDEPMEFGYDLTDITNQLDAAMPLKYFFTVTARDGALGEGHIREAAIIDYVVAANGMTTPFDITAADGVKIESGGGKTYITVVVQGRGVHAPSNVTIADGQLSWEAPIRSGLTLTGYRVTRGSEVIGEVGADTHSFPLPDNTVCTYGVAAIYGTQTSKAVTADVPPVANTLKAYLFGQKTGLSLPDVFGNHYDQATIEYWINPKSLLDWNQGLGPGWGTFLAHANANGTFTAGWSTDQRINVANALKLSIWTHIAMVVDKNVFTVYVNGVKADDITSDQYSGLGGFGNLNFNYDSGSGYNHLDGRLKEIRIWKCARTADEIKNNILVEFGDAGLPADLIAYYKGDLITDDGVKKLRDHTAYHRHGILANSSYQVSTVTGPAMKASTDLSISIDQPTATIYAGIPTTLRATTGTGVKTIAWTVAGTDTDGLLATAPSVTFPQAGRYQIVAQATSAAGTTANDTIEVEAVQAPAPDATFSASATTVIAGDPVSLHVSKPMLGYAYHWQMPGANMDETFTTDAAATYNAPGTHPVTLTVTAPDGRQATATQNIAVVATAPVADFAISPAIAMKGDQIVLNDCSRYEPTAWNWTLFNGAQAIMGHLKDHTFIATSPGRYNLTLTVSNDEGASTKTENNALIVCNADSKNGLTFAGTGNRVTLTQVPFSATQTAFTIDWWMRPGSFDGGECLGIGDASSSLKITTSSVGAMSLTIAGKTVTTERDFVVPGEWHHYAVTFAGGTAHFYRDGVNMLDKAVGTSTVSGLERFAIGLEDAPMRGQIDEFRVWNRLLSADKLQSICNQPIADADVAANESSYGLAVYYRFNQSGGNVEDATSNANTGVRSGFGPDGDAWGLSLGVFSLNFEETATDVTANYLVNYKSAFAHTGNVYNPTGGTRFMELKDWTRENEGETSQPTGAHVDTQKDNCLTITTKWDGFAESLTNHKVYQTITLPAGCYAFEATYGNYEGEADGCYLVAAKGTGLPNTDELAGEALGFLALPAKGSTITSHAAVFVVGEEQPVSVGVVANMNGKQCTSWSAFALKQYPVTMMEKVPDGITGLPLPTIGRQGIYDLSGRRLNKIVSDGFYIVDGKKVYHKAH